MAEDSVFLSDDSVPTDPSSPTADEIIAGGESKVKAKSSDGDNEKQHVKDKSLNLPVEDEDIKSSQTAEKRCKEEEDDKLKQNESGTLLSRGGEFEAEPHQTDNVLNDIQTNSDIRFFICGSCKYNPILIGSVPKLLPCLHSFCENCLQERYEKQKESEDDSSSEKDTPRLKCPSCGQEFLVAGNEKPTSSFLNNQFVIESTPSKGMNNTTDPEEDHQCTSCDDRSAASSYCLNCNEWLCDACVNAHQRVKMTKDHIIQPRSNCKDSPPSNETSTTDGDNKRKPLYCKMHPQEQLILFCANCEKLTCRDCQLIEHKDHRYQFIDEAASKHREILKKLLQYLQINLGLLKETINDVDKVYDGLSLKQNELEDTINKAFNGIVNAIKIRQELLIKELKNLVVSKQMLLGKQKKDLTQMKVILEHNHDFAEFAVKGGSNVALLYSRKVLGTRLHNLNSLKYRQRPLAVSDLKFSMDVDKLQSYFSKVGAVFSHEDMQRKIDHYNSKASGNNPPRTIALSSHRIVSGKTAVTSKPNPIESMTAINKRISEHQSTTSNPQTKYINLSKQGSLGLPGHQMVCTPPSSSTYSNSTQIHKRFNTPTTSTQEMIVLSSSHSGKVAAHVNEGKMLAKDGRYNPHFSNQRDHMKMISPKTPYEHKSFQFHHLSSQGNREGRSSISSPMNEAAIHWPKVKAEHANKVKPASNNDRLQKNDCLTNVNHKNGNNVVSERSSSTRSTGSDGSTHSGHLSLGGIVVKQEGQSPDSQNISILHKSHHGQEDVRSESGFDEGQNEDYCGVCRNGGELLCCDTCPKVYHLHCHVPAMKALPSDSWSCNLCVDIGVESNHAVGTKRKFSEGMTDWELKLCHKLLLHLFVHVDSSPFHHKVSKVQVPDYYKVITRPMDFSTVLTKLATHHFEHYQTIQDFIIDIRLVFSNCFVYNSAESEVCKMGRRLEAFFDGLLRKYIPHQNHYPDTEAKVKRARKEESGVF